MRLTSYHFPFCAFLFILVHHHLLIQQVNSASFYGASFVSVPMEDSRESTKLVFKLKTRRPDSLIFLATGPKDYCLVSLDAGNIRIRINLGGGEQVIDGPSGLKLNDLEWHEVIIDRKENVLTLAIDGIHRREHSLSDRYFELNINYGVYIGGIGNFTQVYLGNYNNFRGCLEKLVFNDVDVLERARETRAIIKDVTFDCSSEFTAYSSEPISFLGDGSYLTFPYDTASTRHGGSLTFDLKTGASMGILFYITSKNPMILDFFGVELVNGQLQLSANDGNGVIMLQSDVMVNNGHWHRVEIDFSPSRYVLTVNEKSRETRPSMGENRYFDFNTDLYVGGIETTKLHLAAKQGMRSLFGDELDVSFKGCLQYVKLNGQLLGLQEVSVSKQIKTGCVWEYVCLVSEPCVDTAECVQDDYDSFRCFCDAEQCVKENYSSNNQRSPRQQLPVFSDDPLGIQLLTISPLIVLEGTNELITEKHIEIAPELNKYNIDDNSVIYIVTNPSHGVIEIDRFAASRNMPDTAFRYSQLIHRGIRYIHDGSDSGNDSIVLKIEFFSRSLRLPDYLEGSDIMSGHGSEIMVDDSGRGSIGYDRSSTMISEITPFYPGLTNNGPSSCTNLSIRSNPPTPISSFGKGPLKNLPASRYEPDVTTGDELFPLPPPSLYFGCDKIRYDSPGESKYSSPRLYSFQPMTNVKSASNCIPSSLSPDSNEVIDLLPPPPSPPLRSDLNNLGEDACGLRSSLPQNFVNTCQTSPWRCNQIGGSDDTQSNLYDLKESVSHCSHLTASLGNNCIYGNHINTLPSTLKRNKEKCNKYWI